MSPRDVSVRAREKYGFASLLENALRAEGHVVRRSPELIDVPDLLIVSVTSPLSPAASYALHGLRALGDAVRRDWPVMLVVDDPMLNKTQAGAKSAQRSMERLYTPYMKSKRVGNVAATIHQKERVARGIDVLASDQWPLTLIPMHPWGAEWALTHGLGLESTSPVMWLDPSSLATIAGPTVAASASPAPTAMWFTDQHYSKQTLDPDRVTWPVIPIDTTGMGSPSDIYAAARGVHQGAVSGSPYLTGWWTPTPRFVAAARTVFLADGVESAEMGGPYYLTPEQVEECTPREHRELAAAQAEHLKEQSWDRDTFSSQLRAALGRATSCDKPGTTTSSTASSPGSSSESSTPVPRSTE